MVNATKINIHIRHSEKRQNFSKVSEESTVQSEKHESFYTLDLSGINGKEGHGAYAHDDSAAFLDLSEEIKEKLAGGMSVEESDTEAVEGNSESELTDETRRLTRKLVAARSTIQVQDVLREAYMSMKDWLMAAASGDKKAMAVIRKLQKLVRRGNRKVSDLNKEQVLRDRRDKAEKKEQEQIAQKLRDELKRAIQTRKLRERRYLQDKDDDNEDEQDPFGPSMAATEAKIQALAQAMAALSTSPGSGAGTDMGTGDMGSFSEGSASAEGGIEGAEATGADISGDI